MRLKPWPIYAIVLLAFVLRVYALGGPSLWLDEAHTWYFSSLPWDGLFNSLRVVGVHPPVYFGLEKIVIQTLGQLEWSLRILSVFMDLLALAAFARIGRLAGGSSGSVVAACFWALRPLNIWYAGEARPYALAAALACGLVAVFLTLRQRSSFWLWLAAWASMAVGLLVHYFFFLLIGAITLWVLAERRGPRFLRQWLISVVLAVIPLGLWLLWMFQQPQVTLGIGWIQRPLLSDYPKTLWNLFSGYGNVWTWGVILFGAGALALTVLGLVFDTPDRLARRALLCGLLLPLGAVWLISQARPVYYDRYFVVLLPFVGITLGVGARAVWLRSMTAASHCWPRATVYGALIVFAAAGLAAGWSVHTEAGLAREDWRALAAMLRQQSEPLPAIWLTDPEAIVPLSYYYHGELSLLTSSSPPACTTACWYVFRPPYPVGHAQYRLQPVLPDSAACGLQAQWISSTGISIWRVKCE